MKEDARATSSRTTEGSRVGLGLFPQSVLAGATFDEGYASVAGGGNVSTFESTATHGRFARLSDGSPKSGGARGRVRVKWDDDEPARDDSEGLRARTDDVEVPVQVEAGLARGAGTGRPAASVYMQSFAA
jgi:hypothetical protein